MGIISSKEKKGGTKWERIKKRLKQAIPYAVVAASAVSIAGEVRFILSPYYSRFMLIGSRPPLLHQSRLPPMLSP